MVTEFDGHRAIKIEAKNKDTNEKVFSGEAKVAPSVTLYLFAGQDICSM